MLTRIHCDKFGDAVPNKTIRFQEGLNIVLGADGDTNSIGKSTALLIVDFCFGGNTYQQQGDVTKNIGHHTIYFSFKFGEEEFHFGRSTDDPSHYWECDERFAAIGDPRPIKDLTDFLKVHYLPDARKSFRNLVSRFMRINGKNNYDTLKPLRATTNKVDDAEAISTLEDLFGRLAELEDTKARLDEAKASSTSFKAAQAGNWIHLSLTKKSDYEAARRRVAELEPEISQVKSRIEAGDNQDDPEISPEIVQIRSELSFETRKKSRLLARIKKLSAALEGESMTESDLHSLRTLFPGVDLRNLEEIATFRARLAANVNSEIEAERENIQSELAETESNIIALKAKLQELGIDPSASKSLLERYNAMNDELRKLKKQMELYEKNQATTTAKKDLRAELARLEPDILSSLTKSLNEEMEAINDRLYVIKRLPPSISFPNSSKYVFETPNDTGTGTVFKSLIVLDLALLNLSVLPVLIHDSLIFSDIWSEPVSNLFAEYMRNQKQSFIAIDGIEKFDEETRRTIEEASRIRLGGGSNSLFGFSWAVKKEE